MSIRGLCRWGERLFLAAGCLLLAWALWQRCRLAAFQTHPGWFTTREAAAPGIKIVGRLEIPRLNASVIVLEGDNDQILALGAGHVPGTARLGEAGNAVIAGHRDTVFRSLRNLRTGDLIRLRTKGANTSYVVKNLQIVEPDDISVLKPGSRPILTLLTCYPFSYIGDAPKRYVVQSDLTR